MMVQWWAGQFALYILATAYFSCSHGKIKEYLSDTLINNVVADPRTGRLYVGAVNALYQLNSNLEVESRTETGPKRDNRQCTPPVTDACEEAVDTDNHNKLLLVHSAKDVLVVCGSVFRGICSLRNLSNAEQLLYFSDTKGEKSYVASAEEGVSVVAVMSYFTKDRDNFTVGKGYGSHDSTKLISTRILQDYGDWVVFDSIIEASAVQANPFVLRYLHDFRFAFKDGGFVYFLFSRTLGVQDTKNFTFISRMCEDDQGYYSYTELQLNCSVSNTYNKVQCYCFTGILPSLLQNNMAFKYKCGAEFLPSPLASKAEFALSSEPALTRKGHLTAVAVAVEMGHAVAFLGTSTGEVKALCILWGFFVCKGDNIRNVELYYILLVRLNLQHLVLLFQITKVSVQACHLKTDCQSCIDMKDPYCGWCVLEGKCSRKAECSRSIEENTWLWSPKQQCVQITAFAPPNISCRKTQQVDIFIPSLPRLRSNDSLLCVFDSYTSEAAVDNYSKVVTCSLPEPANIPPTPEQQGRLTLKPVTPSIILGCGSQLVGRRTVFNGLRDILKIFMYRKSIELSLCISCVTSDWGCQWDAKEHHCSDQDDLVYRSHIPGHCPQFEAPEPLLIPVGFEIPISFQGRNLGIYTVLSNLLSSSVVVLYNCSVNRGDCSLCKHADSKYQCVWCAASHTCVYRDLCLSEQPELCPNPEITDIIPHYGPLNGHIAVTIKGSNMGIKKEDIKMITVAGVDCVHQEDRYSVSTRYKPWLCPNFVSLEMLGFFLTRTTRSDILSLSFQDPNPNYVTPAKGPAAGGTVITIEGEDLDTATIDDVAVNVGGVPCEVCIRVSSYIFLMKNKNELKFICLCSGGRSIVVVGNGFDLIQRATMKVLPSMDEFPQGTAPIEVCIGTIIVKFGDGEWLVGSVYYARKDDIPLAIIIPAVIVPMLLFIAISVYCYRRKSQQAEREYEKVKHQLENLEESVRDRCKKEFTDLMIEMEDNTSDLSEARIPFLDYKNYTDRTFFLPSKEGANDVMVTGKIKIPENRRAIVSQALNQFSNLLNSKTFLINFIRTLESRPDFNARSRGYFASLLTVALHGKLEYYTDIMRTLLLELMDEHVQNKNPKLMLRRSETVVERMLCNWMSICLYQFLRDTAGEPLYKLFKALKHQVEKGPVDAKLKKAKYTLNDTGLLGDDVEYSVLTLQVLVHGEGPDVTPVKVLNCDTITQVKEKIIDQVYRNLPYSQRPKVESVALEWRPGSTGQILSDLDLTSQKEGRWKRLNTLAHYNVRDNATLVLSRVLHTQSFHQHQDSHEEKNALLEDDNTYHLVRQADEIDEGKSKRGSMKDKAMTKAITEIYLTRLLSVKGTLQQFVDDFFRSVLCSSLVVPPAVKYFFDFLDEQAQRHDNVDEETLHIWKTNSLPMRFWVNMLRNPHFIFDVHVTEVVDASLHVIAQTFMDACTKSEHKLSRESPSNKLLYAKEISTYKKMVDDYYKGIRQMVPVSDQDMNTHLAEVSRQHTDKLNTQVALHQLYQYASKYYDVIIQSLDDDPAAQNRQLTFRLQQIAAALENKVTDL
uniref:Plexin b2a n=1 Tax=Neogobius melanostomus TaxID=47308 RepID=A0A8C6U750_9GOBI